MKTSFRTIKQSYLCGQKGPVLESNEKIKYIQNLYKNNNQ